jgi:hypothetical protein
MMRRRRPLVRAAVVGGTAYYAGKKVSQNRQAEADQEARIAELEAQQAEQQYAAPAPAPAAEAPAAGGGLADEIAKLKSLLDSGALTQDEFDAAKQRIIAGG